MKDGLQNRNKGERCEGGWAAPKKKGTKRKCIESFCYFFKKYEIDSNQKKQI